MLDASQWSAMPDAFKTHELAVDTYCACAAGGAVGFQLVHLYLTGPESKPFLMLVCDSGSQADIAFVQSLVDDIESMPCKYSPWWYDHFRTRRTVREVLEPDSVAIVMHLAEMLELDNTSSETANAGIRRSIKSALQQKLIRLADVPMNYVLRSGS